MQGHTHKATSTFFYILPYVALFLIKNMQRNRNHLTSVSSFTLFNKDVTKESISSNVKSLTPHA